MARCAHDVAFWANRWAWTYDPRLRDCPNLPFDLFPVQERLLRWFTELEEQQQNGLIEKTRDSGATYCCCLYAVHGWLYREGFAAGFGSRKLQLVDRLGDPDSIFEKIRIILRNLPVWMLPAGYREDAHSAFARIQNPQNGSTLTGEGGDQIGRGGRKTIYFVDEFAYVERADLIDASLSQTTRCRVDLSTPNGPGNAFYRKRHSGNVPVFIMDWRDDPRKNVVAERVLADGTIETYYPWYEAECARIDAPVIIAQELDRDYSASIEGICIPAAWVRAAVDLHESARFKRDWPAWSPHGPVVCGLDVADEGKNQNVLVARCGSVVTAIEAWGQCNTTQTAWRAADAAERLGAAHLNYDAVGVGAGVKGTWESASERNLAFEPQALLSGQQPSRLIWPDGRESRERFLNARAEWWWLLRRRFERAYEYVTQGERHDPEEMISIRNVPELIADLSMPLYRHTETGKVKIESKDDMRRRGVKSPDYADALVYAFVPDLAGPAGAPVVMMQAPLARPEEQAPEGTPIASINADGLIVARPRPRSGSLTY